MSVTILKEVLGKIPVAHRVFDKRNDVLTVDFSDGTQLFMQHEQDCCEYVSLEDVVGDWKDLYGYPILVAEERTTEELFGSEPFTEDLNQWTFYTFRNIGGTVDLRWFGTSNGYYSVAISYFVRPKKLL